MKYEYMVKTKGMSVWNNIESFGESLQEMLNQEGNAYVELGWELFSVQVLSDVQTGGNNGLVYVYRRPQH